MLSLTVGLNQNKEIKMNQSNKSNSLEENLRDTKHNKKANTVFLKLLAKQRSKHKNWDDAKAEIYPIRETKPGPDYA